MEMDMVGMRSVAAADGATTGPDFGLQRLGTLDTFEMFDSRDEKLAGWDPALTPDSDEEIRLQFRDDLEWSGDGAQNDHIVWRFQ
jgi:hypothetical protein